MKADCFKKVLGVVPLSLSLLVLGCFGREVEPAKLPSTKAEAGGVKGPPPVDVPRPAAIAAERRKDDPDKFGEPPDKKQGVIATCAAFSPDNKYVLVGFGGGSRRDKPRRTHLADCLIMWEVTTGKQVRMLKGHEGGVSFVSFLPDRDRAISGGADGMCRIWEVHTGRELSSFTLFGDGFKAALSLDGKRLLAYDGRSLELWDVPGTKRINSAHMRKELLYAIALSPNGDLALLTSYNFYLWDTFKASAIQEFKLTKVGKPVPKMGGSFRVVEGFGPPGAFAQNGKHAVFCKYQGERRFLSVWDLAARIEIRQFGDESLWPAAVGFSADGNVICQCEDSRLVCLDIDGKEIWSRESKDLERLRFFVFSNDGKRGVSNNYGILQVLGESIPGDIELPSGFVLSVWNLENGTLLRTLALPKLRD